MSEKTIFFSAGGKVNIGNYENVDFTVGLSVKIDENTDLDKELEDAKVNLAKVKTFVKKEYVSELTSLKKAFSDRQ